MKLLFAGALLAAAIASPALAQTDPGDVPNKPKPAKAEAPAAGPEATVYDNALGPGWENWSWAATELSVDTGTARKPIRVEAKGYQGLYLRHAPFSTAPYRGISMLIQVVGGEAEVRVIAIADGKPIPDPAKPAQNNEPTPRMKLVALKPGGWTKVVVPLDTLGAKDRTIDGFWVQNNSGADAPKFYVADVQLMP
ncbi:hypothetical protein ACFQ1E_02080 [Sphingomonas canadensis]|uniref:Uncharacterized protein n=1 Tax=Sphingomonas canadensis TaxID=1219257 RepID=A0ABW3H1V4_9SPHN|nr:hypothetical protein [Sphingomonas canadensis]MCW3834971.1 hypothetical protein [Sphingomonas canadensis]